METIFSHKKEVALRGVLIRMFTNFGRELVSSADLCYNEVSEKPPSERWHGAAVTEGACVT